MLLLIGDLVLVDFIWIELINHLKIEIIVLLSIAIIGYNINFMHQ